MTAAVYRSTAGFGVPPTQNTAPVLGFNCMYTHDLRRKQKRWQDGFLRYHTFNKRVMVYDVPRNFVGDMHWKAAEVLREGDEITLEKDGVLVQVGESVDQTETDLTELRNSVKKSHGEAAVSPAARAALSPVPGRLGGPGSRPLPQMKHRSLNALLGTPKGPIGKSVLPARSPFEERHAEAENKAWEEGRAPKRQRNDGSTWNVTRISSTAEAETRKKKVVPPTGQKRLRVHEVIDLRDEDEGSLPARFLPESSNDSLQPPSSLVRDKPSSKKSTAAGSSSPAFKTQKVLTRRETASNKPRPCHPKAALGAAGLSDDVTKASDEPTTKKDRKDQEQPPLQRKPVTSRPLKQRRPSPNDADDQPVSTPRLTTAAPKKKMLICQDQLSNKPKRVTSIDTDVGADLLLEAASDDENLTQGRRQRRKLEERLARIKRKEVKAVAAASVKITNDAVKSTEDGGGGQPEPGVYEREQTRPHTPYEATALQLAELDNIILPSSCRPSAEPVEEKESEVEATEPVVAEQPIVNEPMKVNPQPPEDTCPFQKTVSDNGPPAKLKPRRRPGAPMRFTPAVSTTKVAAEHSKTVTNPKDTATAGPKLAQNPTNPPQRLNSKFNKPLLRAVSLNTAAHGTSAVMIGRPFQAPKTPNAAAATAAAAQEEALPQPPPNPWSREAFDLFDWRPPGWDEEKWCLRDGRGS